MEATTFGFEAEVLVPITDLRYKLRDRGHALGFSKYLRIRKDYSEGGKRGWMTELQIGPVPGLEAAKQELCCLLDGLRVMGGKISPRCGLHIHVGTVPPNVDWIAGLVATERYWLPVQDAFFEKAFGPRWFEHKQYLARLFYIAPWAPKEISTAAAFESSQATRRHAFNAAGAIDKHRTLEYRLWPMTFDEGKALVFLEASAEHAALIDWDDILSSARYFELKERAAEAAAKRDEWRRHIDEFFRACLLAEIEQRKQQERGEQREEGKSA